MSHTAALESGSVEDPQQALLALYRAPPLDALNAPAFGHPPVPTVSAAALTERDVLAGYLQRFSAGFNAPVDDKAAVSIWSKFYLATVSIPALVANLLLEVALPVAPEEVRLELDERGKTARLWLGNSGRPLASLAPDTRFAPLFEQHCAPLIETLASLSGLSPRVFWSNLGHYVDYAARICARHPAFTGAVMRCWTTCPCGCCPTGGVIRYTSRCAIWRWGPARLPGCAGSAASNTVKPASRCVATAPSNPTTARSGIATEVTPEVMTERLCLYLFLPVGRQGERTVAYYLARLSRRVYRRCGA